MLEELSREQVVDGHTPVDELIDSLGEREFVSFLETEMEPRPLFVKGYHGTALLNKGKACSHHISQKNCFKA